MGATPSRRDSRWTIRCQALFSVLFRVVSLIFLRVIPGWFGFAATYLFGGYVLTWLLLDWRSRSRLTENRITFASLMLGTSTRHRAVNVVHLVMNALLLLLVWDLYFSPHMFPSHRAATLQFARMGHIGQSLAIVHVRYPTPLPPLTGLWDIGIDESGSLTDAEVINAAPLRVVWRRVMEADSDNAALSAIRDPRRWERGPLLYLNESADWTATATLSSLMPATMYEWRLAFVHNNTFAPMPARPHRFTTWPDPRLAAYHQTKHATTNATGSAAAENALVPFDDPNHFRFGAVSCVKPDFPYHPAQFWAWNWLLRLLGIGREQGGITTRNRVPGFDLMADKLVDPYPPSQPGLRFLLELGDMIYADVPRYEGPFLDSYRKLYRNLFASHSFQRVFQAIPVIGMFDDHEIVNNWTGDIDPNNDTTEASTTSATPVGLSVGLQAWQEYIGLANPPSASKNEHYYSFRYGDTAFFVLDTRKHRTGLETDADSRSIIGREQREALMSWLADVNHTATFKFIASSVPFTSLWGGPLDFDGRTDGWSYFENDRREVLDAVHYVPNVILLSGDRHEFASISFRNSTTEFSTSPLSMFCTYHLDILEAGY